MFTTAFLLAAGERAVRTVAQTALSFLVVGQTGLFDVDWAVVGSVSGAAGLASILTSIVASGVSGAGPAFGTEQLDPPAHRAE